MQEQKIKRILKEDPKLTKTKPMVIYQITTFKNGKTISMNIKEK